MRKLVPLAGPSFTVQQQVRPAVASAFGATSDGVSVSRKRIPEAPRSHRGDQKSEPDVLGDNARGQILAEISRSNVTRRAEEEVWEE